jgi:hypothetical protein
METRSKLLLGGGVTLLSYLYYRTMGKGANSLPSPPKSLPSLRNDVRRILGAYLPPPEDEANLLGLTDEAISDNLSVRLGILKEEGKSYRGYTLCDTLVNVAIPWHLPDDTLAYGFVRVWARIVTRPKKYMGQDGIEHVWEVKYEPVFIPNPNMPAFLDPWAMVPAGLNTVYTRQDPNKYSAWEPNADRNPFPNGPCDGNQLKRMISPRGGDSSLLEPAFLFRDEVKNVWCDLSFAPTGSQHRNCGNLLAVGE